MLADLCRSCSVQPTLILGGGGGENSDKYEKYINCLGSSTICHYFKKVYGYFFHDCNSAAFIVRWGDHLNVAIPQGDQKNFTHTVGGSLKIYKT